MCFLWVCFSCGMFGCLWGPLFTRHPQDGWDFWTQKEYKSPKRMGFCIPHLRECCFLVAMIHTKKYALTKDQYWKNPQNPPGYVIYSNYSSLITQKEESIFCCICKFLWNFINYPRIRSGLVLPHLHPTSLTSGFSTMSSTKPICRRSVDCGMAADNKRSSAGCCPVIFIINLWHWKKGADFFTCPNHHLSTNCLI